jgi:hypothetical protein
VLDLSDAFLTVGQQPIDPGEDDGTTADTFLAPSLDFLGFLVGKHLNSEEKAKIAYHASGPRGSRTVADRWRCSISSASAGSTSPLSHRRTPRISWSPQA